MLKQIFLVVRRQTSRCDKILFHIANVVIPSNDRIMFTALYPCIVLIKFEVNYFFIYMYLLTHCIPVSSFPIGSCCFQNSLPTRSTENELSFKVLHPTCLYMQKIFQMATAINIYAHEYPTISKYHMLPTHLRGGIWTKKICFFTIELYENLQISHGKTTKHARIFEILAFMLTLFSFRSFKTRKTWGTHVLKNPIGLYMFAYFCH